MTREIIKHCIFWISFLLLWSAHDLAYHSNFFDLVLGNMGTQWPYVPLVYFNLFVLVPQFLLRKRYGLYLFILGSCILLATFFTSWISFVFYSKIGRNYPTAEFFWSIEGRITILTEILVLVGLTMTLYLLQEWYQKERYTREVEQKKLETELNLLKSQINPHFLFNSLNSIYVMSEKDAVAGRKMLLQFSDILSHQIYESSKEKVPLAKEIDNLSNYIKIEKVRHEDLARVCWEFPEQVNGQQIAPMLLLPIVENAFKHGQSSDGYWIKVRLALEAENNLSFWVENSFKPGRLSIQGGLGLSNLKRRLELIYPNNHQMELSKSENIFKVCLKIKLHEQPLYRS